MDLIATTPWYNDGPLLASWAGVVVNGLLALLTYWLLRKTIEHNDRTYSTATRKAVPELLLPTSDNVYCIAAPLGDGNSPPAAAYFFRLPILMREAEAQSVEAFAVSLHRKSDSGWAPVPGWIPSPFLWRTEPHPERANDIVPQDSVRWCNFGHIVDPATRIMLGDYGPGLDGMNTPVLHFDIDAKSFRKNHLVGPGLYRIRIEVSGRNVSVRKWDLDFVFNSDWRDDLDYMTTNVLSFATIVPVVSDQGR